MSILFIDCIATDKSKLDIASILRSRLSSLLALAGLNCCVTDADFETNNFGGEIGITLKYVTCYSNIRFLNCNTKIINF